MIFKSIEPWSEDEPFVEIGADGRVIDLHNWASFLGFEYRLPESLFVRFDFDETEGGLRDGSPSRQITLHFEGVTRLEVEHQEVKPAYEPETLHALVYRRINEASGWVQFTMMDGLAITFKAGSVGFEEINQKTS